MDSFQEKLVEKVQNIFHASGPSQQCHHWIKKLIVAWYLRSVFASCLLPFNQSDIGNDLICSLTQVTEICQQMKERMYTVYEENSDEMQVKLQELSEVLESCTKLNHELQEATRALTCLREGLTISHASEP